MGWNFFNSNGESKELYKSASTISDTAPTNAVPGDMWTNTSNMVTYVYYSDGTSSQWVEVANNARPTTMYGTFANRPAASTTGLYYFATDTSRLYIDNGTTWQEVASSSTPAGGDLTGTYPSPTIAAPESWSEIGASGKPAFTNSWVNYGDIYNTAGYYKDRQGIVYLKGLIKSGTRGSAAFTLPSGYRPEKAHIFSTMTNDQLGRVDVYNNGNVIPVNIATGSNAYQSIDGICFRAA